MLTALKVLFLMTFATYSNSVVVEAQAIEAEEVAKEVELEIENLRVLEADEVPGDILELKIQPKAK